MGYLIVTIGNYARLLGGFQGSFHDIESKYLGLNCAIKRENTTIGVVWFE